MRLMLASEIKRLGDIAIGFRLLLELIFDGVHQLRDFGHGFPYSPRLLV